MGTFAKVLIVIGASIGLLGVVVLSFRNEGAVTNSAAQQWPGQRGSLENVANRWPRYDPTDSSFKLKALADALPKSDNIVDDFVAREIKRDELEITGSPALPDVSSIRYLLLKEPILWERHDEIGNQQATELRAMHMRMARALVANALVKARAKDSSAWDDLHAVWKLAGSLDNQPQLMLQTAVLSMVRMINAVAWRMPLPAPGWLNELQEHDDVRVLLDSFQFQAAAYWKSGARWFPTKWLAESIDHDRQIAEELSRSTGCDVNTPMNQLGTDLTSLWRRAFRYRAEREATANALRVREGKSIETSSRCSDGSWTFDGTTLRFSRQIPTEPPDNPMPLVLRFK